jgi:hypothetical protein
LKIEVFQKNEIILIENQIDIELDTLKMDKSIANEIIITEKEYEFEIGIYEIELSEFLKIMMNNFIY